MNDNGRHIESDHSFEIPRVLRGWVLIERRHRQATFGVHINSDLGKQVNLDSHIIKDIFKKPNLPWLVQHSVPSDSISCSAQTSLNARPLPKTRYPSPHT
jgi:hypothetical protein